MYPLDCVPDNIILKWLDCLGEKTISQTIQWNVTQDMLSAPLDSTWIFRVTRHADAYFIGISQLHPNGRVDWVTLVNKVVRNTLFNYVQEFEANIRRYASAGEEWQKTLNKFHLLITSS